MVWPFSRCACGPEREKKNANYDSDDDNLGVSNEDSAKTNKTADADKEPSFWEAAWWWETGRRCDGTVITGRPLTIYERYPALYHEYEEGSEEKFMKDRESDGIEDSDSMEDSAEEDFSYKLEDSAEEEEHEIDGAPRALRNPTGTRYGL
mmetsp:Transcript_44385/g.73993  ORF Transcript_44385/g.73993 Transcript_44385/m.73993 type:complete len:150 (-) Transcript_44385:88-537(-)